MSDIQPPPTYASPVIVDEASGTTQFNPIWLKWFIDLAQVINAAGGTSLNHNDLSGLQGGTTAQEYHLTQGEHTAISGTKAANIVLAGPTAGAAAQPAFRALVTADLAAQLVTYAKIQNVSATDMVLGRSTAGAGIVEEIPCTSAGRALIGDANAAAQRTTLELGTMAQENIGVAAFGPAAVASITIVNGIVTAIS